MLNAYAYPDSNTNALGVFGPNIAERTTASSHVDGPHSHDSASTFKFACLTTRNISECKIDFKFEDPNCAKLNAQSPPGFFLPLVLTTSH